MQSTHGRGNQPETHRYGSLLILPLEALRRSCWLEYHPSAELVATTFSNNTNTLPGGVVRRWMSLETTHKTSSRSQRTRSN